MFNLSFFLARGAPADTVKSLALMVQKLNELLHLIKCKKASSLTLPSCTSRFTNRRTQAFPLRWLQRLFAEESAKETFVFTLFPVFFPPPQNSKGSNFSKSITKIPYPMCHHTCSRSSLSTSVFSALREEKKVTVRLMSRFRVKDCYNASKKTQLVSSYSPSSRTHTQTFKGPIPHLAPVPVCT